MGRIEEIQNDIKVLEAMKVMYEQVSLSGGYHTAMMDEIDSQISDSKEFLNNVKNTKHKKVIEMLNAGGGYDGGGYDLISVVTGLTIQTIKNIEKNELSGVTK